MCLSTAPAQGLACAGARAPSLLPPDCVFITSDSRLRCAQVLAVAAVQMERRNNCVPRWGCLDCWNKLLSPAPHLQHRHNPCPPPSPHSTLQFPTAPCGGLFAVRSVQFTWVIISSLGITHTDDARREIPLGRLRPPGLLQCWALFLHLIDIGQRLSETQPSSRRGRPWITA